MNFLLIIDLTSMFEVTSHNRTSLSECNSISSRRVELAFSCSRSPLVKIYFSVLEAPSHNTTSFSKTTQLRPRLLIQESVFSWLLRSRAYAPAYPLPLTPAPARSRDCARVRPRAPVPVLPCAHVPARACACAPACSLLVRVYSCCWKEAFFWRVSSFAFSTSLA